MGFNFICRISIPLIALAVLSPTFGIAQQNGQAATDQLGQEDIWGNPTFVGGVTNGGPAGRQVAFSHVDLADKGNFRGSVRIISDIPIAMTAEQQTVNLRNETITALLPSMTSAGSPKSTVFFPIYRDGPEQATQLFLLNGTEDSRVKFNFFREDGTELSAILR